MTKVSAELARCVGALSATTVLIGTRLGRYLMLLALLVVSSLGFNAPSALAALHPGASEYFESDGTATGLPFGHTVTDLKYDQKNDRLFVLRPSTFSPNGEQGTGPQPPRGIFAYDTPVAGVHSAAGGGFPIQVAALPTTDWRGIFAIDEVEGNIYYAEVDSCCSSPYGTLYAFDKFGSPLGGSFPLTLTEGIGQLVVDPLGYLWVSSGDGIDKYTPEGTFVETFDLPGYSSELVFDKVTGDVWASGSQNNTTLFGTVKWTAASNYTEHGPYLQLDVSAVDGSSGTLYSATGGNEITAYNESGSLLERFGDDFPQDPNWIEVDLSEARGDVYAVANRETGPGTGETNGAFAPQLMGKVWVFPGAIVPNVDTGPPTDVGQTDATLTGHLDLAGGPAATGCSFEYAPAKSFNEAHSVTLAGASGGTFTITYSNSGSFNGTTGPIPYNATAAEVKAILGSEPQIDEADVEVSGSPGGPYTIEFIGRFIGQDVFGFFASSDGLSPSGATATLTVIRHGGQSNWAGAESVPCLPAASPESPIAASSDVTGELSGLTTSTEYRYRLVATNSNGTNLGTDESVTPSPSLTVTGAATDVDRTSATLNGTVDPEGLETTFYFQYGKTKQYGQTSSAPPGESVGSSEAGAKVVDAVVEGLAPGATYHYRLVAVNSKGTSVGLDQTFAAAPAVANVSTDPATDIDRTDVTLNGKLDPDGLETKYYFQYGKTKRYGSVSSAPPGTDVGTTSPGETTVSFLASGLEPETDYHYRLVATNSFGTTFGQDRTVKTLPAVVGVQTDPVSDVDTTSATLNGRLDPDGLATTYYFAWGKTSFYGHTTPVPPGADVGTSDPGTLSVSVGLDNLEPGTTYHYRLVAANGFGTTLGADQSFSTPQAPSIEGVSSTDVTATSANLTARINPNGFETKYRFEYGTTTAYGSLAPISDGLLGPLSSGQSVTVPIGGLQGTTYHFRLVAENEWGSTTSEDQTLDFNPPSCPNSAVRQQTGAAYLPDCRAYELVSPGRAGGAALLPDGPASPAANNRFAFAAALNAIPGAGSPPNGGTEGDLYVASRTTSGWQTRYVGIPGDQTIGQTGLPGETLGPSNMPADTQMNRFLTWDNSESRNYVGHLWDNEGNALGHLPTNISEVPGAESPLSSGGFVGVARPSRDFSHYVFSSRNIAFAPGGLTIAPGSVYDNELSSGSVSIVSKTSSGEDIPQDASVGNSNEFIRIPAVSDDGSHILMSTVAPTGTHLYLRVDGVVTYDISVGDGGVNHGVEFEGMTPDGSQVYFTTAAQMTDDSDTSVDLYRWSEETDSLTRLSTGTEGHGDNDGCNPQWTTKCGVEVVDIDTHKSAGTFQKAQPIDNALAPESGDIYFYSPEELEGARGLPGNRNLYVWRDGEVQFVAALGGSPSSKVDRINVSADGGHVAFVTESDITAYDNDGFAEMYSYDVEARNLLCVSCHPDGDPPTSDVKGSINGRFMSDDGRTFFATRDALVERDANGLTDVYEYVGGRAQLISSGTGDDEGDGIRPAGLVGVSADGVNAFFATYQTLVAQDENGPFYKFYVARVNGGFPFNKPPAPCAAADECHAGGSSATVPPQIGSGASLGVGGNLSPAKAKAKKRKRGRKARGKRKDDQRRHRGGRNGRVR